MTTIDHDRAYEIALDSELGVTTTAHPLTFTGPGPTWICDIEGCHRTRTTACKPAGCANDRIDGREFKSQIRGYLVNDEVELGWDE